MRNLRLGVVDESRTAESRELVSALTREPDLPARAAPIRPRRPSSGEALAAGRLDVGVVVPYDYARRRARGRPVTVQVLLNAANANTAQIAQGYVEGAVAWLNQQAERDRALGTEPPPTARPWTGRRPPRRVRQARVEVRPTFLYNPGLVNTWFIVTGVFGTLIILNGSLVAAATMIREKERGHRRAAPDDAGQRPRGHRGQDHPPLRAARWAWSSFVLVVARLVFHIPFRGSLLLVLVASRLLRADRDRASGRSSRRSRAPRTRPSSSASSSTRRSRCCRAR